MRPKRSREEDDGGENLLTEAAFGCREDESDSFLNGFPRYLPYDPPYDLAPQMKRCLEKFIVNVLFATTGKCYHVSMGPGDTLHILKARLGECAGVGIDQLRIVWHGREVTDRIPWDDVVGSHSADSAAFTVLAYERV